MFNPSSPPPDSEIECAEVDSGRTDHGFDDHGTSQRASLPACVHDYDRLTLEQWIDLCA
jgi:hypothetical protein